MPLLITSLSLGLVSVPLAFLSIMLLRLPPGSESSALVLVGNPFAMLGIIFGLSGIDLGAYVT